MIFKVSIKINLAKNLMNTNLDFRSECKNPISLKSQEV